jgi:pseudouridine kinase
MPSPPIRQADPRASHADVVVIGGANVDVKCRTSASAVLRTSNPGHTTTTPGGVARNVAENLARLGVRVALVSAVGADAHGAALLDATHAAGVDVSAIARVDEPTGTYTAILDVSGELVIAVAAMAAVDALSPATIDAQRDRIAQARILVLDCNLRDDTLMRALEIARDAGTRVVVDPVSVPKAARLRAALDAGLPVFTITPNLDELAALTGVQGNITASVGALHERAVRHVWVRLGAEGSVLSARDRCGPLQRIPALPGCVVDVTGACDAMLAGYVYALLRDEPPVRAVRYGHAAAAITIASDQTVAPGMSATALENVLAGESK